MNGVLNVLKPPGMTSSDVVVHLRRMLGIKKVGHTGTLDPEATGVLPVCLGKATRIADYIMNTTKIYRCEILLGIETDTSDVTGKILSSTDTYPERENVEKAIHSFIGEIDQKPPMYSAIKHEGKKLYELARQGHEIDIPSRRVIIEDIKILDIPSPKNYFIEVICSKGTYIRSLCRDIGRQLGCGATMSFLLRYKTGEFNLIDSYTLDEIENSFRKNCLDKLVIPIDGALTNFMPAIILDSNVLQRVIHGNKVPLSLVTSKLDSLDSDQPCRIYCDNQFIGIGYKQEDFIQIKNVLL